MQGTSIKHWSEDDRPREKMLLKGTDALSNAELLAIIINNGTREKSAVDVTKELLAAVGNDLHRLGRLSVKEIVKLKVKGIGEAKAVAIAAALEVGIRREAADNKKDVVLNSKDIAEFLRAKLKYMKREVFVVVFLNRANKIMHHEIISEGGITGTVADPRIILKKALEHDAVNIILCHNHPSGSIKPSRQDEELTQKIKEAARYLDIKVMDHIIVSEEGYYSFADEGML
ncbi:DNA repair protein RadC [Panacibacter ginsenosidivorans]|uniref:DNA repair protein RadC n=1 Tax=Panacibacter ginsenosidivorans TaxID=1813871 RepID=A0A5B8V3B0_9BACT|nr:DNA repair protein RadC [Panacibacter ginsenosidivorans]QEC65854.1 DNA repair protein RadC [Panacibacter ginsenosidivorans]